MATTGSTVTLMFIRELTVGQCSTNAKVRGIAMRGRYYRIEMTGDDQWRVHMIPKKGEVEYLEFDSRRDAQDFLEGER